MMKKWYSLIDKVYRTENLEEAYRQVRRNKGAPGIDGETVEAYGENLEKNLAHLHHDLKTDNYKPDPVLRVEIEKEGKKEKRPLGIPTVRDRVVQQALLNILQPIFDPDFHPSSYGYRPNCSCQKAVAKAERFMNKYGLRHAVDMDLSKCFDLLDHELIIKSVNRKVSDGRILKLIRQFLEAGIMKDGNLERVSLGSPQGGVISPLLANIYLDYFDQKMKSKGIRIVRTADDILIFAQTKRQAKRYLKLAMEILEDELKLVVNREKTTLSKVDKGVSYLGFVIFPNNTVIEPKRIKRFKDKIRRLTRRNQPKNVEQIIKELTPILRGWINYYCAANCKKVISDLMAWIRRRLRMKKMREWKSWKPLHKELHRRNYRGEFKKISMYRWRNSVSPLIQMALPNKWFEEMGLYNLEKCVVGTLFHHRE